jgi:hypothetical protein
MSAEGVIFRKSEVKLPGWTGVSFEPVFEKVSFEPVQKIPRPWQTHSHTCVSVWKPKYTKNRKFRTFQQIQNFKITQTIEENKKKMQDEAQLMQCIALNDDIFVALQGLVCF